MSENEERRELTEAPPEKPDRPAPDPRRENMRRMFMLLAGGYLIYLGIQLGLGVLRGETTGSGRVISVIAVLLFIPVGILTIVLNVRTMIRNFRDSVAAMAELEDEADEE